MKYVVAFDPGPHTGVAVVMRTATTVELVKAATYDFKDGLTALYVKIVDAIELFNRADEPPEYVDVVCESFRTFSGMIASTNEAVLTACLAGFVEGYSLYTSHPFAWQTPSARMPFVSKARTLLKVSDSKEDRHAAAALAHALAHIERTPVN